MRQRLLSLESIQKTADFLEGAVLIQRVMRGVRNEIALFRPRRGGEQLAAHIGRHDAVPLAVKDEQGRRHIMDIADRFKAVLQEPMHRQERIEIGADIGC